MVHPPKQAVHTPLMQLEPPGHVWPQAPQLFGSAFVLAQPAGQQVSVDPQPPLHPTQVPSTQLEPVGHALLQVPQFIGSAFVSVQLSAQQLSPEAQSPQGFGVVHFPSRHI